MTNGGMGFVIQANADINKTQLERLLKAADAPNTSHTALNNPTYALHLKTNVAPLSHFYLRNYDNDGDENDWKQYSAKEYFDKYGGQAKNGIGLQVCNEPGFGKDITDRLIPFMQESIARNIPISIGGFSVGVIPDSVAGWVVYDNFVQLLCSRPDLLTFDSHEYGLGVPTSGMITAQTKDGEVLYFTTALLRKDQWPKQFLGYITNAYHVGRVWHLMEYCRIKGYQKPTVDTGEGIIDFVSDVAAINNWGKSRPHTNPNPAIGHIRGYKSMGVFWPTEVAPGQSIQQTHMDMLAWARDVVYTPLGVRSMRIFTYGNSGKANTPLDWQDFDWNTDPDMQDVFWRYHMAHTPPPPPVDPPPVPEPPPPPKEYTYGHRVLLRGTSPDELSALETYFRLQIEAAKDSILPSMKGVTEIQVINGE